MIASPVPSPGDPGSVVVRFIHIITYLLILAGVRFLLWGVLAFQLVCHLLGSAPHAGAQRLGFTVTDYVYRIWLYLTYSSNERPFPFRRRQKDFGTDD